MTGNGYPKFFSSLSKIRIDLRDIYRLDRSKGYGVDVTDDVAFENKRSKILFVPSVNEAINSSIHRALVLSDAMVEIGQGVNGYESSIVEQIRQVGKVDCVVMVFLGEYLIRPKDKTTDIPITSPAPMAVFWLGHLTAMLGRRKVVVLHEDGPYFKCPTNYFEASYIPLDVDGRWKTTLSQHLKSLGVRVNENTSIDSFFNMKAAA